MRAALCMLLVTLGMVCQVQATTMLERGQYLVEILAACGNCHTPRDRPAEQRTLHLAGGFRFEEGFGIAMVPNITPDQETGLGLWTDAEIIRAIREGKGQDGHTLGPPMPYAMYRQLSDTDVKAIVAYLRTVPAVHNPVPRSQYTIPLPESYGPALTTVPDLALCTEQGFAQYHAWGLLPRGWAIAVQGQTAEGIAQIRQGFAAWQAKGARVCLPWMLALLADACGRAGQVEEGLRALREALELMQTTQDRVYEAEVYRLQGELLLQQSTGQQEAAAASVQQALAVARQQQAKSLELRAAMSLARLWQQQGQRAAAYELLAEVYGWFSEGFDTAALQEARALLEEWT